MKLLCVFIFLLLFWHCSYAPKKGMEISVSGVYSIDSSMSNSIDFHSDSSSSTSDEFLLLKLINLSGGTIFLPCEKINNKYLYNPNRIDSYPEGDTTAHFSLIDCYGCNKFVTLKPNDSISVFSNISEHSICSNLDGDSLVFYYPYVLDTSYILVNFFKIGVIIDECHISPTMPRFFEVSTLRRPDH